MNSRKRFYETMRYGKPDHLPRFEEGIRKEVLKVWRRQDKRSFEDFLHRPPFDKREEIELDLEPRLGLKGRPTTLDELDTLRRALKPHQRGRLPRGWSKRLRDWRGRDRVLMLRVHRGFFLSMGVDDWHGFRGLMFSCIRDPEFVRESMKIQGEFAAKLVERVLQDVKVDAAVFSEPIGGIDLDALRHDREAIRWEVEGKVQPLVADGGYIPLADGRVREDVTLDNYLYYRRLLEKVTQG